VLRVPDSRITSLPAADPSRTPSPSVLQPCLKTTLMSALAGTTVSHVLTNLALLNSPTGTYTFSNGTTQACYLNTTLSVPCQQGRVPVIGVDARTPKDIQEAVKLHNLRLIIKNTGFPISFSRVCELTFLPDTTILEGAPAGVLFYNMNSPYEEYDSFSPTDATGSVTYEKSLFVIFFMKIRLPTDRGDTPTPPRICSRRSFVSLPRSSTKVTEAMVSDLSRYHPNVTAGQTQATFSLRFLDLHTPNQVSLLQTKPSCSKTFSSTMSPALPLTVRLEPRVRYPLGYYPKMS
jgi:hypothetical protein